MADRDGLKKHVEKLFQESVSVKQAVIKDHLSTLVQIAEAIADSLSNGGKILTCGNGGSAADAQHLAAELLVRLRPTVNRAPLAAIALAMDPSAMTACGNDYGFEGYFERMVRALGRSGDVLLGITTSGNSPNVIRAFKAAREMKIVTIGFLGAGGGPALKECDLSFVVPSSVTGRIQESHITAGHAVLEMVEEILLQSGKISLQ